MDKSINLGKLQNDLIKANALLAAANDEVACATSVLLSAQRVLDHAKEKRKNASMSVDAAKTSMLEAARTVAAV